MTTRYDVSSPRAGKDGKTFWHRIGTAFPAKDGDGMNVVLESLPLPDKDGRVSFVIRPAKDLREASGTGRRPQAEQYRQTSHQAPIDDNVPF